MYCEKCGGEIPDGAAFCEQCGTRVGTDSANDSDKSYIKWILGGAGGGIAVVVVIVAVLFATGVFGGKGDAKQAVTGTQSDTGVTEPATPPEESVVTPTTTQTPAPEPTESPAEIAGNDEPNELTEQDVPDDSIDDEDVTVTRGPVETYEQYIETFIEAVNTGNADSLGQVLSGKVYEQQRAVVKDYYKRGIWEELESYTISSVKRVNDSCTRVNAKEHIMVFYSDGSSKVVKQKYSYICEYINETWMITGMKDIK